jgi:hypothetical protein
MTMVIQSYPLSTNADLVASRSPFPHVIPGLLLNYKYNSQHIRSKPNSIYLLGA